MGETEALVLKLIVYLIVELGFKLRANWPQSTMIIP